MPDIRLIAYGSPDYLAAVILRRAVLRAPLGLDFTPEQLSAEDRDLHIAAFAEGRLVGAVILTPRDDAGFKLRQMAVSEDTRGKGTGAALLGFAEAQARQRGGTRILLEARLTAQGFYERFGYRAHGDIFTQVTLPHIMMDKSI